MYENITFETILQRMLDRIPDQLDKRESSVIYNALAPAAIELQLMYIEFDVILKETFGDTASREYLIRRALERGIEPYPATKAILKAEFTPNNIEIDIGTRFNLNDLNYCVVEKIFDGTYKIECEEEGVKGNQYLGDMIPIEYINGLETAKITELLIPGEEEEDTEELRKRYFSSFSTKPYGGNRKDYIEKTNAIAGVGATKVTPVWNGGGTVKLTIINSEFNKANNVLVEKVQELIDPSKDGSGLGIAPIGHIVTVDTVEEVKISINSNIVFDDGYSFESLANKIESIIEEYFLELRKDWANQNSLIIRIAQIDTRILKVEGVLDISETKINGLRQNLTLESNEVPVLRGIND